jgi:hypothetical protein
LIAASVFSGEQTPYFTTGIATGIHRQLPVGLGDRGRVPGWAARRDPDGYWW